MKWFYYLLLLCFIACQSDQPTTSTPTTKTTEPSDRSSTIRSTELNSSATGINFSNNLRETPNLNRLNYEYFYNGGGVAVGDINNDGLPDIYFTGNMVADKLYLNKGDMIFEDITETAGITFENDWHTGVTMVDINTDGHLDIYVCRSGWYTDKNMLTNRLYINNKDNTFTESAEQYGLADDGIGVQATFFDADRDGDLDVLVLNNPEKKPQVNNLIAYKQELATGKYSTDRFYENVNGKFINKTAQAGFNTFGYRHGVSVGDFDNDGWPDVYISSDFDDPDYLFMNNGNGTFTDRIHEKMDHISMFSMGNDQADINHDGFLDLFVADMTPGNHERSKQNMASMNPAKFYGMTQTGFHHQYMINTLQLNNAGRSFSNICHMAGLASTDWSWSTLFLDWDLDGFDDLFITNGIKRDVLNNDVRIKAKKLMQEQNRQPDAMQVLNLMPTNKIDNNFFKNTGDLSFVNKSEDWIGTKPFNSNGAAYGDLDNDGDLDLVINNVDDAATILQNNAKNNFIKVKVKGPAKNPDGIGTRVKVFTSDMIQTKELYPTRGFYSCVENILQFGLGQNEAIDKIEVSLNGKKKIISKPQSNNLLVVDFKSFDLADDRRTSGDKTLFKSVDPMTLGLDFVHKENSFDDFEKEILLPHRYSQNGPFLSTGDVNDDGLTDVFIGGASGQAGQLYIQNKGGTFKNAVNNSFEQDATYEDMKSVMFDADGDKDLDLYVVSGGYEQTDGSPYYQDRLYYNDGQGNFSKANVLAKTTTSGQSVAVSDIDGDGDLDVFRGSRVKAGLYPHTTPSIFMMNENGKFTSTNSIDIQGLITDVQFADVNNDQSPDLIVTGEWMAPTYFINKNGSFDKGIKLGKNGWHHCILVDDIDKDGRVDLISGNMGENNKFHPDQDHPLHVYASDFDNNGTNDIVLSKLYKGNKVPVRGRECSSQQMPFIQEKFPTFKEFAEARLEDVYGDKLDDALHRQVESMSHTAWSNLNDPRSIVISREAQRSPWMDVVKLDKNGQTYYIAAGNHYHAEVETSRYDAGIGATLQYKDDMLQMLPLAKSGLFLRGDVKDLEVVNLDGGTSILIASQNNGGLLVYKVL